MHCPTEWIIWWEVPITKLVKPAPTGGFISLGSASRIPAGVLAGLRGLFFVGSSAHSPRSGLLVCRDLCSQLQSAPHKFAVCSAIQVSTSNGPTWYKSGTKMVQVRVKSYDHLQKWALVSSNVNIWNMCPAQHYCKIAALVPFSLQRSVRLQQGMRGLIQRCSNIAATLS